MNQKQQETINGSLLGDGSLWLNTKISHHKSKLTKRQSKLDKCGIEKISYMDWHKKTFAEFGVNVTSVIQKLNGKSHPAYIFRTNANKVFSQLEKEWYLRDDQGNHIKDHKGWRIKIVPRSTRLTPLTLCVWHMDDGYANPKDANIELNTQGFLEDDIDFLIERLDADLGLTGSKKMDRGKIKIFIGTKDYFNFIEMIKPHVEWDCFQYKLDIHTYDKTKQVGENHSQSKLTDIKVQRIRDMKKNGLSHEKVASKFGITSASISAILSGKTWSHVDDPNPIAIKKKPRLTNKLKSQIIEFHNQGKSQKEIAILAGCNQSTISRTIRKQK